MTSPKELREIVERLSKLAEDIETEVGQLRARRHARDAAPQGKAQERDPYAERLNLLSTAYAESRSRQVRTRYIRPQLLGEPAWDILVDLLINELNDKRVSVTSACIASQVPATTALRWLTLLERDNLVKREKANGDKRRRWISLTVEGRRAITEALRHSPNYPGNRWPS
ncbi:hypothetical protein GCM10011371_33160 [Novosphingobium marinum]|uniref:DNA-binding MarR family transcriptional regulator n=1 Tax=Novosphingobium marinum TaxID=1514948 RepID=A0A7Z0BX66_9SPHN|nr:MarR family transcriptional regulator [Novosphingobium marinum]NYH97042.1 DNA-binding MarR family transcriptional regulator [Novosphingobium marinum]GGC43093.1 hypothetical protein GCM10011371_33160 [Novosphingobium marinum]